MDNGPATDKGPRVAAVMHRIDDLRSGAMLDIMEAIDMWSRDRHLPDVAFRARVEDVMAYYRETVGW